MSSVVWDGDNLIQRVGDNIDELGHVKHDSNSNSYVLWLRDLRDLFGVNKGYVRGDSFPSMKDAKRHAANSTSAWLFHFMWLVGLRDRQQVSDADIAQFMTDAEGGKPLTVSTFKEEMGAIKSALQRAEKDANEKERNARKREILFFIAGLVIGLIGIAVSVL